MDDTIVSPTIDAAIRKRQQQYKMKSSPGSFRDLLRLRCRERVKSHRVNLMERYRNSDVAQISTELRAILKEEKDKILNDPSAQPLFESEILMDYDDSAADDDIFSQYEQILQEELDEALRSEFICPLCKKGALRQESSTSVCLNCRNSFAAPLEQLKTAIHSAITSHQSKCDQSPDFTLLDDIFLHGLFLICDSCTHISQVL